MIYFNRGHFSSNPFQIFTLTYFFLLLMANNFTYSTNHQSKSCFLTINLLKKVACDEVYPHAPNGAAEGLEAKRVS